MAAALNAAKRATQRSAARRSQSLIATCSCGPIALCPMDGTALSRIHCLRVSGGCASSRTTRRETKESPMCDFSLQSVRSRPAKVGDKLVTRDFGTGTRGFAAANDPGMAVCILPGTELAFTGDVACLPAGLLGWKTKTINHQTAIFRQVNKEKLAAHHDALEFPDGRTVLLTLLCEGQTTTVLQLPAQPTTEIEAREQERVGFIG